MKKAILNLLLLSACTAVVLANMPSHPNGRNDARNRENKKSQVYTSWSLLDCLLGLIWISIKLSILGGYILLTSMVTQYLEHALLSSGLLCKLCRAKMSRDEAKALFYQIYWTIAVLFTLSSSLWLLVTGRTSAKWLYGICLMFLWLLCQVGLALVANSSQGPLQKYLFKSTTEKKQQEIPHEKA